MLTVEELSAALNDPASPLREKLLNHLSLSPLDPAAAYGEIMKADKMMAGSMIPGSMVPEAPQQGSFSQLMTPQQDLSREANPMGVVNLANSAEVMPQSSSLMPGEQGGMPTASTDYKKLFEGLAGMRQEEEPRLPTPSAPAPRGNNWSTFKAEQFQTPAVGAPLSLADLLEGRRR